MPSPRPTVRNLICRRCRYAHGRGAHRAGAQTAALYCDDEVASGLLKAGTDVGDPLWRMPIWRPYRKDIEGKCADLNNVAKGTFAGSIIGALYLAEFVSPNTRWVHLDVMAANV